MKECRKQISIAILCVLGFFMALAANAAEASDSSEKSFAQTQELDNLRGILPLIATWRSAISHHNVAAALQAGEEVDLAWNGIEVYLNFRSVPLYTEFEVDTLDVMLDELLSAQPNFRRLSKLVDHLEKTFKVAIGLSKAGPALSLLFDDVATLRKVRANLLGARDALTDGDVDKAKTFFDLFADGYPSVTALLALRSATAETETTAAFNAARTAFNSPSAGAAELTPLVAQLLDRYNFGLNLHNAAARTADSHKTSVSDDDKLQLTRLNQVQIDLTHSLEEFPTNPQAAAAGGATGPGSVFAQVQPALEAKARFVNTAATLRSALAAYALVVANTASSLAAVEAAYNKASEQIAIAQQTLVGQFWTDPDLQAFLGSLPTN